MLSRYTPLRRKTPLRSRSRTKKYALRERDQDYLAFIRWCKCCLAGNSEYECRGRVEADHAGEKAGWQKADDATCIPLCHRHHRHRTGDINGTGHFKGWSRDRKDAWRREQIKFHRNLYEHCVRLRQTPWRRKVA